MDFSAEIALLFIFTCVYYTVAGVLVFVVDTKQKARQVYLLTKLCLAGWALSNGMMTISPNELSAYIYFSIGFVCFSLFIPSWADFMYRFTECRSAALRHVITALYISSALAAIMHIFFSGISFIRTSFGYLFLLAPAPQTIFVTLNILLCAIVIVYLHFRWVRISIAKWYKRQAILISLLSLVVITPAMFTDMISPLISTTPVVPVASIFLVIVTIPLNLVMRKQRLLNITATDIAEDIFSSVNQPILVLKFDNRVSLSNSAAGRFWPFDIFDKNIADLMLVNNIRPDESLFDDNFYLSEGLTVNSSNGVRYCSALLSVIRDSKKGVISKIIIFNDITELISALNKAHQASRARTEFLAKISHEIRTPMNAIIGLTDLALHEDSLTNAQEHLFTVKQASLSLLALINDILDFSKIEAKKMEIVPNDYSVASLINDAVSLIRMRLVSSDLRFVVSVDKNIPGTLYGDETRIRQSLLNLLSNAVKYTDEGHVSLDVSGYYLEDGSFELVFKVTDTGRGIKSEDITKLKRFADFTQFDIDKNRDVEGVGLGLAITNSLVSLMGGFVDVQSEYGKGSTFTITLPQKVSPGARIAAVTNPADKRIIIYEQHDICAGSTAWSLTNLGIDFTIAENNEALFRLLDKNAYSHLFIAREIFAEIEDELRKRAGKTELVLFAALGDVTVSKGIRTIVTPVYCTNIADLLNGTDGQRNNDDSDDDVIGFTAPDAKVLVVDDIATNRKVTEGILSYYRVQVDMCNDGLSAVDAVKRSYSSEAPRYDLVFMDHKMPGIDGIEATQMIRKLGDEITDENGNYYKDLPIIALTANVVAGMDEIFLENSFNGVLSKPIDKLALNAVLDKWIPGEKKISR